MNHFDWPINMLALIFISVQMGREFGAFHIGLLVSHFRIRGKLALFPLPWECWDWCGSFRSFVWFAWWICLRDYHKLTNLLQHVWSSLCTLIILVAVNLGLGLLPFVDNFAHIGGFLSGFLLGFLLLMKPQYGWMCHDELPLCIEVDLPVKTLAQSLSVCALHLIIPAKSGWFHWCFSFSLHWCGCQQEVFLVPLLELCSNCSLALWQHPQRQFSSNSTILKVPNPQRQFSSNSTIFKGTKPWRQFSSNLTIFKAPNPWRQFSSNSTIFKAYGLSSFRVGKNPSWSDSIICHTEASSVFRSVWRLCMTLSTCTMKTNPKPISLHVSSEFFIIAFFDNHDINVSKMLKSQPPWDWHELSLSSPHSTYARSLSHCHLY